MSWIGTCIKAYPDAYAVAACHLVGWNNRKISAFGVSNSATSRNHLTFLLAAAPLLLVVMSLLSPIYNRTPSLCFYYVYPNLSPSPQPCSGETKNVPGGRCLLNTTIRSIIHSPLKNNHKPIMLRGPRSNLYVGGLD